MRKIALGSANKSFGIEVASLAGVPKVVTDRAKSILKMLEKKDINAKPSVELNDAQDMANSEIYDIINSTDIDMLSPREALDFLYKLKSQIKEK